MIDFFLFKKNVFNTSSKDNIRMTFKMHLIIFLLEMFLGKVFPLIIFLKQ